MEKNLKKKLWGGIYGPSYFDSDCIGKIQRKIRRIDSKAEKKVGETVKTA